ncbi:amidase signature enzyme [Didymella exigua CBS 183.55]|uniref:Amidase signature enzyme n=1 Tax=Didymella exigua CBS 183.55 TaxID=1150837 RepID=A0A6A5RF65_9PLEO|nr:amidase signature enzyme [Didymella exigua CBS 183.55]KAF1926089.1 amidase signature enzyme [Didymella exigua CBS 183.55]
MMKHSSVPSAMTSESTNASNPSLNDISMPELQHLLDSGALTFSQVVCAYRARIAEVDHEFQSVIETNPDACADAQARDTERAADQICSSLHGLPILLKDNVRTLDHRETTCGSIALVGARPRHEAALMTALRDVGAVILGKLEICWSITSPTEKSGVVGYKPAKDLIPSESIIYASKNLDTVGVLTRAVEDAVHVTQSLRESMADGALRHSPKDSSSAAFMDGLLDAIRPKKLDLRGLCTGIPSDLVDLESPPPCKLEAFGRALFRLEIKGSRFVIKVYTEGWHEYGQLTQEQTQIVLHTDRKVTIDEYLSSLQTNPQNTNNLQDLVGFTKTCPEEEFPARNVTGLERAQATDPYGKLYKTMLEKDMYFAGCIADTLDRYNCDVLLIPFLPPVLQTFAAKAGSPVMSVPLGVYPDDTQIVIDPKNDLITEAPGNL